MTSERMTDRQQIFINEYLQCWNATEAARRAGYSERSAQQIGAENLSKPVIADAIKQRIAESTMSADEALIRLSEQARGSIGDFIEIKHGLPFVDLEKAASAGKLHLLKKFKNTDKGIEIELYDAQSALVHILREQHLKSGEPTERTEVTDGLTDAERSARITSILDAARARRTGPASSDPE